MASSFPVVNVSDSALEGYFTQTELRRYRVQFNSAKSKEEATFLSADDLRKRSDRLGFKARLGEEDVAKLVREFDGEGVKGLTFEGFLRLQVALDAGSSYFSPLSKPRTSHSKDFIRSPVYSTCHVVNDSEKAAYAEHLNAYLKDDPHVKHLLPLSDTGVDFVDKLKSGVILCKLVNVAVPGTIDTRAINLKAKLNAWEQNENITLCLNSARAVGCQVASIGTEEVSQGREHIVVALVAQIVKMHLLSSVSFKAAKELVPKADAQQDEEDEEEEQPQKESAEHVLLRWMNHYLVKAGHKGEIRNFSHDLKDGEAYTLLLAELAPETCDTSPLEKEGLERAELLLQQAEKVGCRKFLQPKDVVEGNANLNLAFIANLFNASRDGGLKPKEEEVEEVAEEKPDDGLGDNAQEKQSAPEDAFAELEIEKVDEVSDDGDRSNKLNESVQEEDEAAKVDGEEGKDTVLSKGSEVEGAPKVDNLADEAESDDDDDDDEDLVDEDGSDIHKSDDLEEKQAEELLMADEVEARITAEEASKQEQEAEEAEARKRAEEASKQEQEAEEDKARKIAEEASPREQEKEKVTVVDPQKGKLPGAENHPPKRRSDDDESAMLGEERMYRLWINSLGVTSPVVNLFVDLRDGFTLLEVLDKVKPGIVQWAKAHRPLDPLRDDAMGGVKQKGWRGMYKKLENCSQVLEVGKALNLSLVGIGSDDFASGNPKFLLAFLWQVMRLHTLRALQQLRQDHEVSDNDILTWAVEQVQESHRRMKAEKLNGVPQRAACPLPESFKDKSLASGQFLLELMAAVEPRVVNWSFVSPGRTEDEGLQNATYIISLARKLGCSTFLVTEDITRVRPKVMLMLIASIMAYHLQRGTKASGPFGSSLRPANKYSTSASPSPGPPLSRVLLNTPSPAMHTSSGKVAAASAHFEDVVRSIMPDRSSGTPPAKRDATPEKISSVDDKTPPVHRFSNGLFGPTVSSVGLRRFSTANGGSEKKSPE